MSGTLGFNRALCVKTLSENLRVCKMLVSRQPVGGFAANNAGPDDDRSVRNPNRGPSCAKGSRRNPWRTALLAMLALCFLHAVLGQATSVAAALISPAPGGVLGPSATFAWTAGTGVSQYALWLGTTSGASDLYNSEHITATSVAVTVLPMNGATIYAQLWSYMNGGWLYTPYTFKESVPGLAALISPAPGGVLGPSVTFAWTAGSGVSQYALWLGTTSGASDLYNSGHITTTSGSATGLPMNGATVYAELWSYMNGAWQFIPYTFKEGAPGPAALISPVPGGLLGSSATFTWTAGTGVSQYALWLGTTSGASDLYNSGHITTTSGSATGLPMNGATVYAELWSYMNGAWQFTPYTFKETAPVAAALIGPAPGGVLGSSATFTWTAGTGVSQYALWLGTTSGASDLYNSGHITTTSGSATALPMNGATVYAELWSYMDGGWQFTPYTFKERQAALPVLSAISCGSASMTGSGTDACTVTVNAAAPVGGLIVSLSSNNTAVTIPATVSVPAGATSAGFTAAIASVATAQSVTVTATTGSVAKTFALQLNADMPTMTVSSSSSPSIYGSSVTFTATISTDPPGIVTFYEGGTAIGTGTISGTTATFTTSSLLAGSQSITAKFPGNINYGAATSSPIIQMVNKASPTITWSTPASIIYGTALSGTQLDAASTVAGTFSYSPAAGALLTAGGHTVTTTFTPTDSTDYTTATSSASITVNAATPAITWAAPAAITYGTALSGTQLDASSTLAGTFSYSPAAGTVLTTGNHTITTTFTPTDSTDYTTATSSASITVNAATPAITWAAPAAITYGTAVSGTQLDASSSVAGTFSYSPAAGTVLTTGNHTITTTFTPADSTDYKGATATVTLTVNKATPVISWTTPGAILSGTALSGTQLDASSTIPGMFVYSPAAGAVLAAGSQALSVTFTPTDTTDYTTATKTVTLTVNQGTSTLSINATSIAFGAVALNTPVTQSVTLTSTGAAAVTVNSAVATGTGFTVSGATFPLTLTPGQAVNLGVEFDPTTAGAVTGQLTITSTSSTNGTAVVTLAGTGTTTTYAVDLSWDAPGNSEVPIAGYNIYRAPSGSSTYQQLNSSVDAETTYADSTVQSGLSYEYYVESVSASGMASAPSETFSVTVN
jgi:hypothetical protein